MDEQETTKSPPIEFCDYSSVINYKWLKSTEYVILVSKNRQPQELWSLKPNFKKFNQFIPSENELILFGV